MDLDNILARMSLRERIGQLFMVGFKGVEVKATIRELIEDYYVGGIIFFRHNIKSLPQIATLSNELQKISSKVNRGFPLLVATDQEGGIVTRLTGGTHFPGNMVIGAAGDTDLAAKIGQATARELKAVGINMNLAPVLDINNNPANPVIGVRSYGETPELVAEMGKAYIRGLQGEGVIACGKHFPGHGDTNVDSHLGLASVNHGKKRLTEVELYPFKEAIKAGIESIMTAHLCFPAIEPEEGRPATLSYNVLTNLLRKEMDFKGLIITDSMTMDAIAKSYGTVKGVIMAIDAGADMVIMTLKKQKEALEAVYQAVKDGIISEQKIDDSAKRILNLKQKMIGLDDIPQVDYNLFDKGVNQEIAYQVAKKGVTLVKDEEELLSNNKRYKKVLVIDFPMNIQTLVEDKKEDANSFIGYLKAVGVEVLHHTVSRENTQLPALTGVELVVICTYDALHDSRQIKFVKEMQLKQVPIIVISIRNPYDLKAFPEIPTYLTTYDFSPANLQVASEIIAGKVKPLGNLPIIL